MNEQKVVFTPDENNKDKKDMEKDAGVKETQDESAKTVVNSDTPPPPTVSPKPNLMDTMPLSAPPTTSRKATITATILAVLFIVLGFAGGYLGYKYAPKFKELFTTSADSNTPVANPDTTTPESTSTTPGTLADWPIYTNTKYLYAINYPDTWFSQNTNDPLAKSITLTSTEPTSKSSDNLTVTITARAANGSDLKTWIETNNTVTGEKTGTLSRLSLDGQDAYQQESTGTTKTLNTYIKTGDSVLSFTYTADGTNFDTGKPIYTQIIETIKITSKI